MILTDFHDLDFHDFDTVVSEKKKKKKKKRAEGAGGVRSTKNKKCVLKSVFCSLFSKFLNIIGRTNN